MREQFHRGAKTAFKVRRLEVDRELRDALVARIRPLVDYLAAELAAEALRRLQAEVDRMGEAFEVAISAYVSASDVADVRGGGDPPRMAVPEPAVAAEQGSTSPPPRAPAPDLLEQALGTEIAAMMTPAPDPERRRSDGRKVGAIVCKRCGYVGGNARGCGTAHRTQTAAERIPAAPMTAIVPAAPVKPSPAAVARAKERISRIAARAQAAPPRAAEPEHDQELEDEPDSERWSAQRIAEERELAEANKREGELPMPRSSWVF